jgi:hypothetical protein
MRYLITESKIKKLVFNALSNQVKEMGLEMSDFDNFILYSKRNNDDWPNEVVLEYDFSDGRLYAEIKYFENTLYLFGYSTVEEQKEILSEWFEYYQGIKPKYVQF